jgi:hypothetical protein
VRCPACGARNTDGAAWCTQCYASLRGTPAPVDPARLDRSALDGPPEAAPATGDARPPVAPGGAGPARDAAARDVRTVDGEVEWRCAACDGWTPLERSRCATCETPRRGFGEVPPPPPIPATERGKLLVASVVLPGLGHLVARRVGTGVARLALAGSWLIGALLILGGAGGAGRLPALPLLLGAGVVWVGSAIDVLALVDGGREQLRPRVLSWLTGGVLLAFLVTSVVVAGRGAAS